MTKTFCVRKDTECFFMVNCLQCEQFAYIKKHISPQDWGRGLTKIFAYIYIITKIDRYYAI